MEHLRCARCKRELPAIEFRTRSNGKPFSYCSACEKEYKKEHYKKNSERVKAKTRLWRSENRAKYQSNNKRYYNANIDVLRKKKREYQKANSEALAAKSALWRNNNLERQRSTEARYRERNRLACNARISKWKKSNKHLLAFYTRKRQAQQLRATPSWANDEKMKYIYWYAAQLRKQTGEDWHVDHIVPLNSDSVCGLHVHHNLQILSAKDNLEKLNRHWPDMP